MERYKSLNQFLKDKFGVKVYKVSLEGGFSCPNRDGTKGVDGCIYCNPDSISAFSFREGSIKDQLIKGIEYVRGRHKGTGKYISYFQHYSNTYSDLANLEKLYLEALDYEGVVGLAISTRPDCLSEELFELLERLSKRTYLWLELGLQSANDKTLQFLNRGHTIEDFKNGVLLAHKYGIEVCAHIIAGLPNETKSEFLNTIQLLNDLKVEGVKIHNLHIIKNTKLAEMYNEGFIKVLDIEEYASLVVDCLEYLRPDVLIHRFISHSPRHLTIAPLWSVNKLGTLNAVHNELNKRNTYQGKLFRSS